jgi:enoyl-CoA hydratase/carnithine racemase
MTHAPPHIIRLSDHVLGVRISSDDDPYLGEHTITLLRIVHERVKRETDVRAVVLLGGTRHFSAGASRESLTVTGAGLTITGYVAEIPRLLLATQVPIVAAMAGHAIGGGFVLGLWCDSVVLAEESLYGANFMALGFTPGMGSTVVVEEALGGHFGREMLYSGRLLKGSELREAGSPLSRSILPREQVNTRALDLATEFAAAPRESLTLLKQRLAGRRRGQLEAAVVEERQMHQKLFSKESTLETVAERYAVVQTRSRESR